LEAVQSQLKFEQSTKEQISVLASKYQQDCKDLHEKHAQAKALADKKTLQII
jgi:hypothetical protein